jgi:hypothetical protein
MASVFVFLVYLANVPFYAGSSVGERHSWRMEHGRLTVDRSQATAPKSFWMDLNSEGLRFDWEWKEDGTGDWTLDLPLWIPFGLCLLWLALAWRSGRESAASTK